ncbi:MAG: hypothetical protein KatS3mg096_698 [Candidatus Parcubacteria bacterium]|nr:MAG: hypothetical protein KatS3mg096_671 [Candidatus Parcubacteria bacterium]GIW67830.1 MAG: hypothetical protein KatS3mg096_698 [Candidatus Parcubacteria bacterium]
MVNIFGYNLNINVQSIFGTGFFVVLLVIFIGIILIGLIFILMFFKTYKYRVVLFENVSNQGIQPVARTRAKKIRIGQGGAEILKTWAGKLYLPATKMVGKNVYWFYKANDGYFYNVGLGDFDTRLKNLKLEPIERDMKLFYLNIERIAQDSYNKPKFLERYGVHLLLFVFLLVFILGMWFIIGKIGDVTKTLSNTQQANKEVVEALRDISLSLERIRGTQPVGLVSVQGG